MGSIVFIVWGDGEGACFGDGEGTCFGEGESMCMCVHVGEGEVHAVVRASRSTLR